MPAQVAGHGERQLGPVPTSGPPAGAQGQARPPLAHDRLLQEDLRVGRHGDHHRLRPRHRPAGHSAHRFRPQLYLLLLARLLLLETIESELGRLGTVWGVLALPVNLLAATFEEPIKLY